MKFHLVLAWAVLVTWALGFICQMFPGEHVLSVTAVLWSLPAAWGVVSAVDELRSSDRRAK